MAKADKRLYKCRNCDTEFPKWQGQCTQCHEWNTLEEFSPELTRKSKIIKSAPVHLNYLKSTRTPKRFATKISELDRVTGGGFLLGSVTLIGGDPGIGKSTLALQILETLTKYHHLKSIYFSGEESLEQIALRAKRLNIPDDRFFVSNDMELHQIQNAMENEKPIVIIVDSIQTIYSLNSESLPGSISQVRECASELMTLAKKNNITVIMIGHITKDGAIAGPKLLEHLVDTVLYLEGDKNNYFRILRSVKNRFGATNEIGIFEMAVDGLQSVGNPGDIFLHERTPGVPGSVIACGLESARPLLIEIQALAAKAAYGAPQRNTTGIDHRRLSMLLAIIEKQLKIPVYQYDIFVNIIGGLKFFEPAMDLPVITSILSSILDSAVPEKMSLFGEVGLTGEIRSANMNLQRVEEASRMGYDHIILPTSSKKSLKNMRVNPRLEFVDNIHALMEKLFKS